MRLIRVLIFIGLLGSLGFIQGQEQYIPHAHPERGPFLVYRSTETGIEFKYPKSWEVSCTLYKYKEGDFFLKPKGYESQVRESPYEMNPWLIAVYSRQMSLDHLAARASFQKENGRWQYVGGRMGAGEIAQEISGPGWTGLFGCAHSGRYFKGGGYAGLGEYRDCTALITSSGRSAYIIFDRTDDGRAYDLSYIRFFLASFRFIPCNG